MKKRIVTILVILTALLGVTNDTAQENVKDVMVGFSNVRGFSTARTFNPCNPFQIPEASSTSIDWNNGCVQRFSLSESLTWAAGDWTNGSAQGRMWLVITSDTTPGTITWPSTVAWASVSQNAPNLNSAGRVSIIEFISIASGSNDTYYGEYISGIENMPQ